MDVHRPLLAITALLLLTLATVCLALPVEDISGLEHVRPGLTVYRAYARARSLQLNEIDSEEVGSSSGASKASAKTRQPPRNTTRRPPPPPPPAAETGPTEDVQTAPAAPPTSVEPEVVIQQTPTDEDVEQTETQLKEAAEEPLISVELADATAVSPVDAERAEQTEEPVEQNEEAASEGAPDSPPSDLEQSVNQEAADLTEEVKAAEENTIVSANAEVAPVETVVAEDASVVTVEADATPVQLTVFTAVSGAPEDEGEEVTSDAEAGVADGTEPEQPIPETTPTEAAAAEEQQVVEEFGGVDLVPELLDTEEIPEEAVGTEEVSEEAVGVTEETTAVPDINTEEAPAVGLEEESVVPVSGLEEEPVVPVSGLEEEPVVPDAGLEEEPIAPVSGLEEEPVVPDAGFEGDYVEEDYVDPIGAVEDYVDEPDVPAVDSEVPVQEGEASPAEDTSQYTVQTSIGDLTDSSVAEVQEVNELGTAQVGEGAEQFGEGEEDLGLVGVVTSDPAISVTEPYDLQTGSDTLAQQNALDEQDILADVI